MSSKTPFRFALIGCGAIAKKHILGLKYVTGAEIVGAYDVQSETAHALEKQYGIPAFEKIEDLIEQTDPQILNILTPSGLHGDNILDLARFGRHFVVEKPLALRLDQIDEILSLCDKKGLKIFVVKQNRFNPPILKLKQAIDQGRFGKLVLGTVRVRWCRDQGYYNQKPWRGTWALDGGVLTNQASHHIDMLVWMMGEPESVVAKTSTRLVNIEAEDTGVAIIQFKNGSLGVIEATTATRPKDLEGSISVLGEKGSVEVAGFFMDELRSWNFSEPALGDDEIWDRFATVPKDPNWRHGQFFQNVVESLNNRSQALIDGLEGRKSIELINAIYESVETGQEIKLRFTPKKCRLGVTG